MLRRAHEIFSAAGALPETQMMSELERIGGDTVMTGNRHESKKARVGSVANRLPRRRCHAGWDWAAFGQLSSPTDSSTARI